MGRLCGGAHEISGIPAPLWLCGWLVGWFLGCVGGGGLGVWWGGRVMVGWVCKGMEVVMPGSPSVVAGSENYQVLKFFLGWFISSSLWMVSQVPCPRCCPVLSVFCLCSDLNRVKGLW